MAVAAAAEGGTLLSTGISAQAESKRLSPGLFSQEERELFWRDGFVLRRNVLSRADAAALASHYDSLFSGSFPTGVYPDEWHWRAGISLPNAVRA